MHACPGSRCALDILLQGSPVLVQDPGGCVGRLFLRHLAEKPVYVYFVITTVGRLPLSNLWHLRGQH